MVTFPESVEVSLTPVSDGGDALLKALEGPPGEFSDIIAVGPTETQNGIEIVDSFLSLLDQFEIPVSTGMTQFEATREEEGFVPQEFKFDFTPFDYDGDGVVESCTGTTCPAEGLGGSCPEVVPITDLKKVCYRIWIKRDPSAPFDRLMAGVFDILAVRDDPDTVADERNIGAGNFKVGRVESEGGGTIRSLNGVHYNHRDPSFPLNQTTETLFIGDFVESDGTLGFSTNGHALVSQTEKTDSGGKSYLERTLKITIEEAGSDDFLQQYLGRFRDDADFWSGSFMGPFNGIFLDIPTTCARISTGSGVSPEICTEDLAIDSSQEEFLGPAQESDVVFPVDFPVLPTF